MDIRDAFMLLTIVEKSDGYPYLRSEAQRQLKTMDDGLNKAAQARAQVKEAAKAPQPQPEPSTYKEAQEQANALEPKVDRASASEPERRL